MIKVIAFDLDDTLWHVDPVIRRAESILATWLETTVAGYQYDPARLEPIREMLLSEDPTFRHRLTAFRQHVIARSLEQHLDQQEATRLAAGAMEVFLAARNEVEFFDGVLDTLGQVAKSFRLGALTNGNADIHRLGLNDCFSFAFSAEQVGAPKPAPDLFHAALAHTNCEPAEMIYVGDDPVKDVDAANQVGLHTIWMKSAARPQQGVSEADETIEDIRSLPGAIGRIIGR